MRRCLRDCCCSAVPFVDKLVDLHLGEQCLLVGTIYKKMKLQPSVLKEYAEEVWC
jgi:hypothetical protein